MKGRAVVVLVVALAGVLVLCRESTAAHMARVNREYLRALPDGSETAPGTMAYAPSNPAVRNWLIIGHRVGKVNAGVFYGGILLTLVVVAVGARLLGRSRPELPRPPARTRPL